LGLALVGVFVVSTVGTSLFRNISRSRDYLEVVGRYGVERWVDMSLDSPDNSYPLGRVCGLSGDGYLVNAFVDFIRSDPRASCAELAGVLAVVEDVWARYGKVPIEVGLYPTASCTSYLASRILERYLVSGGFKVSVRVVEAIRSVEGFDEGLASLVDQVIGDVVDYSRRGFKVYVNATPGFKAETSFLVIASILAGASAIYYIHESFRRPVKLPIVPLEVRRDYLSLLESIAREGGVELAYVYSTLGMTEADVKDLEDRYLAYSDEARLKPRKWVVKLLEKLRWLREPEEGL